MAFNRIPPIQCLVTFEAVARLRSGSKAAEELTVTTSAVSPASGNWRPTLASSCCSEASSISPPTARPTSAMCEADSPRWNR